jgi:site-specific recombinase XerD
MSNIRCELIAELKDSLTSQQYSPVVVGNYCAYAREFLDYLAQRARDVATVTPAQVEQYLRHAIRCFRKRHGRRPGPHWHSIPRAGIHALLRLRQGQWPPAARATCAADALQFAICDEYETWLREERGLALPTITALMWEARHFLAWQIGRCGVDSLTGLSVSDIDRYMDLRAPGLTRKSLKDVAERLRSLLRYLHRTGGVAIDLSPHVIAPLLYAYEGIPSALRPDQIAAVLELARKDRSPRGLRDFAILQLLATYGLRSGEIGRLRLEDIDWRRDVLHIRHSKTGAHSVLPLLAPVGEALIAYLRHGRPKTDVREIFVRTRAPYVPMVRIYNEVRRRLEAAGVELSGKRGPHIFRHARAVSLLRAEVPRKVIGDVLGHRSTESTVPYLKLATEDLRAIALEVPGVGVCA